MWQNWNNRAGHYTLLLLVGIFTFFVNLGGPSLWDLDEGRNSAAAYEMMEAQKWVVPTFNAELRPHKPALVYWLQILAYQAFGVNEFAARLPSAVAALLTALLTYELARSMFNPLTGLLSGLAFSTSFLVCFLARFANQDSVLDLCLVLTFALFWHVYHRTGKYPYVLCSAAAGLAVLAKGPLGLVLPVAVIGLYLIWIGKVRILWTPRLALGVLAFCLVALPWYVLVSIDTKGEFLRGFLGRHNVHRFLQPMDYHAAGPYYYLLVVLGGLAPWSVFIGPAGWFGFWSMFARAGRPFFRAWESARDTEVERRAGTGAASRTPDSDPPAADPADRYRFLWLWIGVFVVFFTAAATKLPNYILPVFPPLAILTGRYLDRWVRGQVRVPDPVVGLSLGFFAFIGGLVLVGFPVASGLIPLPGMGKNPTFPELAPWTLLGVVPVLAAVAGFLFVRRRERGRAVFAVGVASILFTGALAAWVASCFDTHKPPRDLVAGSGAFNRAEEIRVGCYRVEHLPSLNFYTQRTIDHMYSPDEVAQFLSYPYPVYLFLSKSSWEELEDQLRGRCRVVGEHADMYRRSEVVVITNR